MRRHLVNAFIVFHLIAVSSWLATDGEGPLAGYVHFMGFWQRWDMFAPRPGALNVHLEALADGKPWPFPRCSTAGLFERFTLERQRKWTETLLAADQAEARRLAALAIARRTGAQHVEIVAHWGEVTLPSEGLGKPNGGRWRAKVIYP
jgi:hypothetical protein